MSNPKEYKKHLISLTKTVAQFLTAFDIIMKEKSTALRGKKLAKICNALDMSNDSAMHFGLDYGWKKIKNIKKVK